MCIIVDANRLGRLLAEPPDEDAVPIQRWLQRAGGTLVYSTGGKFEQELGGKARRQLAIYRRAGKARLISADRLAEEERRLQQGGQMKSDDPHVLALALESGARLLFTGDKRLIADFKDAKLIAKPRGRVYSSVANKRLLTSTVCTSKRARNVTR